MAVDPKEVSEMSRLINLMNGNVNFDEPMTGGGGGGIAAPVTESALPSDVDAMKNILLAFYGNSGALVESETAAAPVQDPIMGLHDRASNNRELREALMTSATEFGARIGSWDIVIQEDARGLKSYDIANVHTGEPIAKELTLYEAARGIVRHLNNGEMINGAKIREILNVEAEYGRARMNAAEFRERARMYESRGDSRAPLMEDRFDDALGKAKAARARLTQLTK